MIIVYVTFPNKEEAEDMTNKLLDKKLIACVNIHQMTSIFDWEGKRENNSEFVAIFKTKKALRDKVKKFILANHSYKVPCVISWEVSVNESYDNWVNEVTE